MKETFTCTEDLAFHYNNRYMFNVMKMVSDKRIEIEFAKKRRIAASDLELIQNVLGNIVPCHIVENNDEANLKYYGKVTNETLWYCANKEEADEIISRLKSGDKKFIKSFFYGTNFGGCNISRLRSRILSSHKGEMDADEFGDIVYSHLWSNGTWSLLDTFSCSSSLFQWLSKVAENEVRKVLNKTSGNNYNAVRNVKNTHLLGMSVRKDVWKEIIGELMPEGFNRSLLTKLLVDRVKADYIMKELDVDAKTFRKYRKDAENELKERLIKDNSDYAAIVLRDNSPRVIRESEETIINTSGNDKDYSNPLADVLGVNLDRDRLHTEVRKFLYDFSNSLDWSDTDRHIWQMRFIENMSPVKLAEQFGQKRSWVDNRYSKANIRFRTAIRKWYYANAA